LLRGVEAAEPARAATVEDSGADAEVSAESILREAFAWREILLPPVSVRRGSSLGTL
jgi:hypothetical protein